MNNNVTASIVSGVSKNGNKFKGVEFCILTSQGPYTCRVFPSSLEIGLIEQAISPVKDIYGSQGNTFPQQGAANEL